ncbi:NADP-dependent 3-hydroxy acid dehydrogenase YdfG [Salsuginibacillus halophilus]|uniref:NADP-dependent 3-hydroxy acid dehydrogenase YdfG n=1 Tax=Salsuginibacillus halophilus TaxID=517424 RepID=A0A2P8HW18_9BACI|nr:SDR family oxidoreductase [Salsuginibacillus halophilus]PSL50419.1 NADP-dependent 3-hydroxy acid dehydrogenase YdfG [Salsuginibacillus halophilus]
MANLQNQTVMMTGASSGIGAAAAKRLAADGANVVLVARRKERLDELVNEITSAGGQAIAVAADITNRAEVEGAVAKAKEAYSTVDVLVNNAGVMLLSMLEKDHVDEWETMVDVNIKGVLFGVHAVLPAMIEQQNGHVINVSSVAGQEVMPSSSVYSATKFAVRAFSMGMEKELTHHGIRTTNISPGPVETELATHITDQDIVERFESMDMPFLKADDIADAIHYAVSQPRSVNVNEVTVRPLRG